MPRLNPYGIIIKKSPNATTRVYAATMLSEPRSPLINSKICMFVFSKRSIKTPGIASYKNSFKFKKVL